MASIIKKTIPLESPFKFFKNLSGSVFFDIETTGLNRYSCICYLIGMMTLQGDNLVIEQFFADKPEEEGEIIKEFLDRISPYEELISFNGDAFDIPFLRERMKQNSLVHKENYESLDLLKVVRGHKHKLNLPNLKLKTLERYAGVYREDQFSGKDMIPLYYSYVNKGDEVAKESILLHNFEDILNMKVLDIVMDKIYKIDSVETQSGNRISLIKHNISKKTLIMELELQTPLEDIYFTDGGDMLSIDKRKVCVNLTLKETQFKGKKILCLDKKEKTFLRGLINENPPYIPEDIIILAVNDSVNIKALPYIAYAYIASFLEK